MIRVKISPNYFSDYLDGSLSKKIDVFSDSMNGWYIDWADKLNSEGHAGFAVLHLAFAYFEAIMIFYKGEDSGKKSKEFFKEGIINVFPHLEKYPETVMDRMYNNGRCGFFHSATAKRGILLSDHDDAISVDSDGNILIDRYKFVAKIKEHFDNYIKMLREGNPEFVDNFLKGWDIVHK